MDWLRRTFAPNRLAVYLTAVGGAAAAGATALETQGEPTSTTGVLVAYGIAAVAVLKWLQGWQAHEARTEEPVDDYAGEEDLGDPGPVAGGPNTPGDAPQP